MILLFGDSLDAMKDPLLEFASSQGLFVKKWLSVVRWLG
ncbi:hypothetical protein B4113_0965 [Geobacillus sp. B4113_201601]|nr:hypothetical protein B4113_0965 [Geobacillus sp. B4113_201601]